MLLQTVSLLLCLALLQFKMVDSVSTIRNNSRSIIPKSERLPKNKFGTVVPRKPKARYRISLQLPDIKMNNLLTDKNSSMHKEMTRTLTNDIQQLFANTMGDQRVYNMQFRAYNGRQKVSGTFNEQDGWQKELPMSVNSAEFKPSSFLLRTMPPFQSSSPLMSKHKERLETSTSSSVAVTSSRVRLVSMPSYSSPKWSFHKRKSTEVNTHITRRQTSSTTALTTSPTTSSSPATTTNRSIPSSHGNNTFDVERVTRLFKECYTAPGSRSYVILIESYLEAYSELLSIFKLIGPAFTFVGNDAMERLKTLTRLRKEDMDVNQDNYLTFQSMFAYEYSPQGAKAKKEGVSTNILIHKTLKLISGIIKVATVTNNQTSLGFQVRELYSKILAPHHEWYMRAAVNLGLLSSFPSRDTFLARMGMTDSPEHRQAFADLTSVIDAVYDDVDNLYVHYTK
uniref:Glycolipid transfer protein domain-containing protein n=1 Tax=Arion vulgaris TaxID=1028688 RepID=A0A0B7BFH2_9EUPU